MRNIFALALIGWLVTGCGSTQITNLTPTHYPRNDTGVYTVEVELKTGQQTLRYDSVTPSVVVGTDVYPMRPTLKTDNRWEGTIMVPKHKEIVSYHFKFDYDYNRFGQPGRDSKLSPEYELKVGAP